MGAPKDVYFFYTYMYAEFHLPEYIYLITLIPRNITSPLQCISASAAGTSAIQVTDEGYFSVAM